MFNPAQYRTVIKLLLGILLVLLFPIAGTVLTSAPILWPISTLLYSLGLLYSFSLIPNSRVKFFTYNVIATVFFLIECFFFYSYYLQNTGFNEAFFYHIRPDLIYAGVQEHLHVLLAMLACLLGFLTMSSLLLYNERSKSPRFIAVALVLLTFGLFISPPARDLGLYVKKFSSSSKDNSYLKNFKDLRSIKVTEDFSDTKKPNIVLIYMESLEQRYFDEAVFPDLLPNLKRLREESIDFSNVSQGVGAGWTIAGMVASQCGYPLTGKFEIGGNGFTIFDDFLPKATCLGDYLKKDGYQISFIGGADSRFAGKNEFLHSHGYDEIIDRDDLLGTLTDKSYKNGWGAFDDTLLDFSLKKFMSLSEKESPFLQTLLTMDTHHPEGFLSKSCKTYGDGGNSTLNAVHCSDLLIPRFIERIRHSPFSDNTIIIVLSDHLAMRNRATSLLESSKEPKRLTFFINTPEGRQEHNANPGVHYDVAPTILNLIGYKINGQMGFGSPLTLGEGYLPNKFGEDNWKNESENIMAIGRTLWNNDASLDKNGIIYTATKQSLSMGGREFNLRSEGVSDNPATAIFIYNNKTLKLENIKIYPFDRGLTNDTFNTELLKYEKKLALIVTSVKYLQGYFEPNISPHQKCFFFGKIGSRSYTSGLITEDFSISLETIHNLVRGI